MRAWLRRLCPILLLILPACSDEGRTIPQAPTIDLNEEIQKGWAQFRVRDFPSAVDHFERVIEQQPDAAPGYVGLGWCRIEVDSMLSAYEILETAVRLDDDEDGLAGLATTASALGRDSIAVVTAAQVTDVTYLFIGDPNFGYTDLVFIQALGLFHLRRYEECRDALLLLDPSLEIDMEAFDFREQLFEALEALAGDV